MSNPPPTAEIQTVSATTGKLVRGSKLWLLTLVCLGIAVGLVWWSMPPQGASIRISFPEGHGLEAEDAVRYRGIEVGTVESVELASDLKGVEASVLLKPFAANLAKEGTRFWVVRPEVSLTRISGLDTAIGHKYIGVSPATESDASTCHNFQGLTEAPVETLTDAGIELILRGDKMYSVSKGSAVTFRGVEVGRIFDVALSHDSRHVDVRIRIMEPYRSLLTSETKFWASSGLDLEFGLGKGFNLDMESLETLARGGISMITPGPGKEVSPGDVFTFYPNAEDEWFAAAAKFGTTQVPLRGAVTIHASWQKPVFSFGASRSQCNGVVVKGAEGGVALFPADFFESAKQQKNVQYQVLGQSIAADSMQSVGSGFVSIPIAPGLLEAIGSFQIPNATPSLTEMELIAVRRPALESTCLHSSIPANSVTASDDGTWQVSGFQGDREVWHGAPVMAVDSGELVGALHFDGEEPTIVGLQN